MHISKYGYNYRTRTIVRYSMCFNGTASPQLFEVGFKKSWGEMLFWMETGKKWPSGLCLRGFGICDMKHKHFQIQEMHPRTLPNLPYLCRCITLRTLYNGACAGNTEGQRYPAVQRLDEQQKGSQTHYTHTHTHAGHTHSLLHQLKWSIYVSNFLWVTEAVAIQDFYPYCIQLEGELLQKLSYANNAHTITHTVINHYLNTLTISNGQQKSSMALKHQ